MKSVKNMLKDLSREELRELAGTKIFNRGNGYLSAVSQLSCIEDGTLVARVAGTKEYVTWVSRLAYGNFDYECTCPYNLGPCKHVMAVLLAAVEKINQKKEIPLLDSDDDLYYEAFEEDDDDWDDDDEECDLPFSKRKASAQIEAMLSGKTRDELQELLAELAADYPDVFRRLHDTMHLESGQVDKLVRSLSREIRDLTCEDAWFNPWNSEGNLPDYSHVEEQLEELLVKGYGDEILQLGEELWKESETQIAESHDDGETAMAISSCLSVVLRALPQTSMTPAEQLVWLIQHDLDDEYNLLEDIESAINEELFTETVWAEAALEIEGWMDEPSKKKNNSYIDKYRRFEMLRWLQSAYLASGQTEKIIPLLEKEAEKSDCYEQLVETLLEAGKYEQARQWCIRGFHNTWDKKRGIALDLQKNLKKLAEIEGREDLVATYTAEEFFNHPSEDSYENLRLAAEKISKWSPIRNSVLSFLQTGKLPVPDSKSKAFWPLPAPEVSCYQPHSKDHPDLEMLIRIALLEKRNEDAVKFFSGFSDKYRFSRGTAEYLADKVAGSHPNTSLQIWQTIVENLINLVKPKAYQQASAYLRRMHIVYTKTKRVEEWQSYIQGLRTQHKAKRRLMEVLNDLTGKRTPLIKE